MFTNRLFYPFFLIVITLAAVTAFTASRTYHESTEKARLESSLSPAQDRYDQMNSFPAVEGSYNASKYEERYDRMNDATSANNANKYENTYDRMTDSANTNNVSNFEDRFDLMNNSGSSYDVSKYEDRYDLMNDFQGADH